MRSMCWAGRCTGSSRRWPPTGSTWRRARLCGALKQVAPLIAPWAEAIAAHGRTAGHVHADETSWQVFEDIEDKDGHRWWLWVFVTDATTVFVMDTSRSAGVAAGQLGIDREQTALEAGRRLVISSDFQGLPVAGLHRRRRPVVVLCSYPAVFPAGRGRSPRGARRLVRRVDRADRGAVPGAPRAGGHHAGHRGPRSDAAGRWQRAFTDIDAHRILQASDAAKGLLHPAAAKVIATLSNEWDGLARHQDLPQLPLDNNTAERALRTPVIGRKNFYGSGAEWAAHLAADVWTVTATAARHDIEPLGLLTGYLQRMRPQRRHRPGRSRPGPLPALDTPRTRPPSSRQRSQGPGP